MGREKPKCMKPERSRHRRGLVAKREWQGLACALMAGTIAGCAFGSQFSTMGSRPKEIAGVWIDSSLTTREDTLAMELSPGGEDHSLSITVERDASGAAVPRQRRAWNGYWYVSGEVGDTTHRAICFRVGAREGATCLRSHLDTLVGMSAHTRRRLVIYGERDQPAVRDRVLLERTP